VWIEVSLLDWHLIIVLEAYPSTRLSVLQLIAFHTLMNHLRWFYVSCVLLYFQYQCNYRCPLWRWTCWDHRSWAILYKLPTQQHSNTGTYSYHFAHFLAHSLSSLVLRKQIVGSLSNGAWCQCAVDCSQLVLRMSCCPFSTLLDCSWILLSTSLRDQSS